LTRRAVTPTSATSATSTASIEGDHPRELARERQYELSVRDIGENAIDQVGRLLVHAPRFFGRPLLVKRSG